MSYNSVLDFKKETGMMKLENKKAIPVIKIETIKMGRINRSNEIPDDLIATSSKLSPRLPNVMMDESKSANGSANGTSEAV
jgi:hypothetical protein